MNTHQLVKKLGVSTTAIVLLGCLMWSQKVSAVSLTPKKPNIVIILADDMGYGELQCLNPKRGKIKTPQLDSIAASGMVFTDGHSGSSVCTPTRYGLMTGRYAWRTRLQKGVLTGGESLIAPDRLTLARMLKQKGYHTAMFGKWHLGMLFNGKKVAKEVLLGSKVTDGPVDAGGFDEFHGFHHARQMKLWIDNDTVTEAIEPIEMLPKLCAGAVDYIRGRKGKEQPFFLYVPWNSPHSPVVPSAKWQGKSGLNAHADFVMQTDDSYGRIIKALRDNDMLDNTLVICGSDNGTSAPTAKREELEAMGHFSSGDLRGSKADIWDGGHRVPFIVQWPSVVKAGSRNDGLVCLSDVMATVAEIIGFKLPADAGEDSLSFLPALKGQGQHARTSVIHHSVSGHFAIRQENYKLIMCPGSGGWTAPKPNAALWKTVEAEGKPTVQLYDMIQDLGEQKNLAGSMPDKVKRMRALLQKQVDGGRTTPGPKQANDAPIRIDKRPGSKNSTKGIIDVKALRRPKGASQLVGRTGYDLVPESDAKCRWTFKDGVLTASPLWDSVVTRESYQDFQMHVEFNVNQVPDVDPEKNGNSGIYIQQRYEVQILNSYGVSEADYTPSHCGSLYRMKKPDRLVNKPAGQWQSFDIAFRAARFDGDKKIENARVTVYQNQQLIHDDVSIRNKTGAGQKEGPDPRPIKLQGHHNPVRFRHVWIKALKLD